jgi:hypothetical protein
MRPIFGNEIADSTVPSLVLQVFPMLSTLEWLQIVMDVKLHFTAGWPINDRDRNALKTSCKIIN